MRRVAIALLVLTGCLKRNPGFDEEQSSVGAVTTEVAGVTTREDSTGPATPTSTGGASTTGDASATTTAEASSGDASTAAIVLTEGTDSSTGGSSGDTGAPIGPELCGESVAGAWNFGGVAALPSPINGPAVEDDPSLAAGGLILLFSSDRDGGMESYRAHRDALGAPFTLVASNDDANVNSSAYDGKLAVTEDSLIGALASSRGSSKVRIFVAERPNFNGTFGTWTPQPLALAAGSDAYDPHLSLDGLRLYLAPSLAGVTRFALARRDDLDQSFMGVEDAMFAAINGLAGEIVDPTLSADERVLVFSYKDVGAPEHDLWYAVRPDVTAAFAGPMPLPGVSEPGLDELAPHLREDGCELFFVGIKAMTTNREIHVATLE